MKNNLPFCISILMLVVASAFVQAHAETCGSTTVLSATSDAGVKTELTLDSSAIKKTPEWSPGIGEPPLSLSKAIEVALPWAKKHFSRFEDVEINRITLTNSACFGASKHWYYIFEFTPVMQGNRMYGAGNWVAVLMDGTLVEAKSRK